MNEKDGGPAYPSEYSLRTNQGMTLRDWFAGKAPAQEIESMIPVTVGECAKFIGMDAADYIGGEYWQEVLAKARYQWADAMLAERAK
jgi:hypothetical protein